MIIECTIKRPGGTPVKVGSHDYEFLPNEAGDHVAEVVDQQDIRRLLSIAEAYRTYQHQPLKLKIKNGAAK